MAYNVFTVFNAIKELRTMRIFVLGRRDSRVGDVGATTVSTVNIYI